MFLATSLLCQKGNSKFLQDIFPLIFFLLKEDEFYVYEILERLHEAKVGRGRAYQEKRVVWTRKWQDLGCW